jgi:NADPH:quinone reductase
MSKNTVVQAKVMSLPMAMQATVVHEQGSPEVMKLESLPMPQVKHGELLVKVNVAGINYADIGVRKGMMGSGKPKDDKPQTAPKQTPPKAPISRGPHEVTFPYTPGFEVVGTVVALGEDVQGFMLGQRVAAVLEQGGYAEYAVAPGQKTYPVPEGLADDAATLMLVQGLTAYGILHDAAKIQAGEWVLVEAAAGGVGHLAAQLARRAGAKVIGAVGSPEKLESIQAFNLDLTVNYSEPNWIEKVMGVTQGKGVDVLLESVGGRVAGAALETTAKFGRVIMFGGASGEMLPFPQLMMGLSAKGLTFTGFNPWLRPERAVHNASEVAKAILSGEVKPLLNRFGLSQVVQAHQAIEGRKVVGKVVLTIS